jgi:hypothetical protein
MGWVVWVVYFHVYYIIVENKIMFAIPPLHLHSPLFSLLKHKTWPELGRELPQIKRVYAFNSINP